MRSIHLEKLALLGDVFAVLCCLGFGPLLAALSAVGAGFLVRDAVLAPLLAVFLALGAAGLSVSRRRHGRWAMLALHATSSVVVLVFTFVAYVPALIWIGLAGLAFAVAWDSWLRRRSTGARGEPTAPSSTGNPA